MTIRDPSGNRAEARVDFTIDDTAPAASMNVIGTPPPIDIHSSDADGATGDVMLDQLFLDGCLLYDGDSYGDRGGNVGEARRTLPGRYAASSCP